uniref:Pheromone binding protein 3 n=1 Tax=Antheraea pernyi TaxID=7119 RepID=Q9NFM6_ANTPE|nr:pheromone binding protein 3 [Antheraea pernyi]
MIAKTFNLLVIVYLSTNTAVDSSQDVMKSMTLTFTKGLDACKKEMDLPDTIDVDFNNFWKEDYVVTNRNAGCAIMCLASKVDLVDSMGILIHGSSHEFAKQHGADDNMAKQLSDTLHSCEKTIGTLNDECLRALNVANCFKVEIHKLDWAPSMDLIIGEILAEI